MSLIEVKHVIKTYQMGDEKFHALNDVSFSIKKGEFVAIMGTSGSGKSTCMNMLGTLDKPTSGEYYLDGIDVFSLDTNKLADIRNNKIGFVFQGFNLISRTSALDNVCLPMIYIFSLELEFAKTLLMIFISGPVRAWAVTHTKTALARSI